MKQTVYAASPESQQIHVWRLNAQPQTLTLLQVVEVGAQVQPLVISPNGRFLYAGVRPDFRVLAFHIASTDGTLSEAGSAPLPGSPTHISLDSQGQLLFSGSYNAGCASVTRLDAGLPGATIQLVEQLDGCHSVNLAPDKRTVWVPALKQDRIALFTLLADGQLQPHSPAQLTTAPGAGPRHMAFHPHQPVAYCLNELNACVDIWHWQNHKIQCLQSISMMPADYSGSCWAADIHLTPDGRFLYTCERSASLLTQFAVAADGCQLTVCGHTPTETQPRGFTIDHSGEFLLAAGQKSHHISLYQLDPQSGALRTTARYPAGQGPMWLVTALLAE